MARIQREKLTPCARYEIIEQREKIYQRIKQQVAGKVNRATAVAKRMNGKTAIGDVQEERFWRVATLRAASLASKSPATLDSEEKKRKRDKNCEKAKQERKRKKEQRRSQKNIVEIVS